MKEKVAKGMEMIPQEDLTKTLLDDLDQLDELIADIAMGRQRHFICMAKINRLREFVKSK